MIVIASCFFPREGTVIMDRIERLLLRVAVLVVLLLIVREFVHREQPQPARPSGGGSMAIAAQNAAALRPS